MKTLTCASFASLAFWVAGCASTPAVTQPVPPQAVEPAPVSPAAEAGPELSPVAAPSGLVARGRVLRPGAVLDELVEWSGFPVDWRAFAGMADEAMFDVIDLEAEVDLAVAMSFGEEPDDLEPTAVVSVGLLSLGKALQAAEKAGIELIELSPGAYRMGRGDSPACAIAVAAGSAPARAICGEGDQFEALLPYVARTLPNEPLEQHAAYLELYAQPWRDHFDPFLRRARAVAVPSLMHELALDYPPFDRALGRAAHGVIDEFFAVATDVDRLTVALELDAQQQAVVSTVELQLSEQTSWLAGALEQARQQQSVPPPEFWALPASAPSVSWAVGTELPQRQELVDSSGDLLLHLLGYWGVPEKLASDARRAAVEALSYSGNTVTAGGSDAPPAGAEGAVLDARPWLVVGLEGGGERWERGIDAAREVLVHPEIQQKVLDSKIVVGKRDLRVKKVAGSVTRYGIRFAEASSGAPSSVRNVQAGGSSEVAVLLIAERGGYAWLSAAATEALAVEHLSEVLEPADGRTLQAVPDLQFLRGRSALGGGATDMGHLLSGIPGLAALLGVSDGSAPRASYDWEVERGDERTRVRFTGRLPRSFLQQLVHSTLVESLSRAL